MATSKTLLFALITTSMFIGNAGYADPISLDASQLKTIAAGKARPETRADILHPDIHQNNDRGNAACPGNKPHCNNMHGIRNVPGQGGAHPSQDAPGFADQLGNVHGGIHDVNKNTPTPK